MLGKSVRLNRIFSHPSGRALVVAIDHGIAYRYDVPLPLHRMDETLARVVEGGPDAVTLQLGAALRAFPPYAGRVPLLMQTTAHAPHRSEDARPIAWVENALRIGADAISCAFFVGRDDQNPAMERAGRLVREAEAVGLPVVAHIYPAFKPGGGAPPLAGAVMYAVHVGYELGVDVVKVPWPGSVDALRRITRDLKIPLVLAGGPKFRTFQDVLAFARNAVKGGAGGLTIGRNVWEHPDIPGAVRQLKAIVHGR